MSESIKKMKYKKLKNSTNKFCFKKIPIIIEGCCKTLEYSKKII